MKKKLNMRCTTEQYYAIKPKLVNCKLIGDSMFDLIEYPYLTNDYNGEGIIGTRDAYLCNQSSAETFEVWDEEVFLNACGIETEKIFKGSELQFKSSIDGEWIDCTISDYYFRFKQQTSKEVKILEQLEQLKAKKEKLEKKLSELKNQ